MGILLATPCSVRTNVFTASVRVSLFYCRQRHIPCKHVQSKRGGVVLRGEEGEGVRDRERKEQTQGASGRKRGARRFEPRSRSAAVRSAGVHTSSDLLTGRVGRVRVAHARTACAGNARTHHACSHSSQRSPSPQEGNLDT
eukprot:6211336-Pleurochrysis_carterae.AAC.2